MRSKLLLAATGIGAGAALLLAPMAIAGQPAYMVNGGGQIISSGATGPGNTIAFTAQSDSSGAGSGQVQYIDRSGGTGQNQVTYHGTVTCVAATGTNMAAIAGQWNDKSGAQYFRIDVTDNGTPASGTDTILVRQDTSPYDCSQDNHSGEMDLGRGNVTIHQASSSSGS